MSAIRFAWDIRKVAANLHEHGVALEEARTVCEEDDALLMPDPGLSVGDDRFALIGLSAARRRALRARRRGCHSHQFGAQGRSRRTRRLCCQEIAMKKHHVFSKAITNGCAKRLKRSVTIRLDDSTVEHFKALAEATQLPYQNLVRLKLRDCAASERHFAWWWWPACAGAV